MTRADFAIGNNYLFNETYFDQVLPVVFKHLKFPWLLMVPHLTKN